LIWINFVHLFMASLLPFATAWVARTRLASFPAVFYAGLFVCVDVAYNVFEREVLVHAAARHLPEPARMASIARSACDLRNRDARRERHATPGVRYDLRRVDPALAAGRAGQDHRSMTTSPVG
jgi:hypothetical protein